MSTTVTDASAENPASEDSGKVSPVKGDNPEGGASGEQTTNGRATSPCQVTEYTPPDSRADTLSYAEHIQPVTDTGGTETEVLVPAETGKEAENEQEGEPTQDQANRTAEKPQEGEVTGENSEVANKGETEERTTNLKDFGVVLVCAESGKEGDQRDQEARDEPAEDDNKQHTEVEDLTVEPQNQAQNVEDKLPDESVVPVTTMSNQESQEPDTMEKAEPEPEEQAPAEQPDKTGDHGTEGESKLEQGPQHGPVIVPDDTVEKEDQRDEETKEEEEEGKKEEEVKKEEEEGKKEEEVKKEEEDNKDEKDKQDEVLESTLQNQTAEKEAFDKLLDENVKLKTENEKLMSEHADISHKYTIFTQEKEQMMKTQAEQEKEIKGLNQEVEDLRIGLGDDSKVQELQQKLLRLTKEHEDKDKRIHSLLSELDSTKGKLREAESKLERNGTGKQEAPKSTTCAIM